MIRRSVELGITKFNVNTEVRTAYITALRELIGAVDSPDLLDLMQGAVTAMGPVVSAKLQLFGSVGKAWQ
jgi:tagatose 1,6-diphosphate aldolase GatY/KbaY